MPPELAQALLQFIILLIAIALHEYGHAKAADLLGDPLPRAQGRVTLNPTAHWSPIGTLLIPGVMILLPALSGGSLPIALIGWGKPVQVSLPNARTRTRDDILTTLAGPGMNLVQAFAFAVALAFVIRYSESGNPLKDFCVTGVFINCSLVAFNMLPIPPLDGSRIARRAFGIGDEAFAKLSLYSIFILLLLVNMKIGGQSALSHITEPMIESLGLGFLSIAGFLIDILPG